MRRTHFPALLLLQIRIGSFRYLSVFIGQIGGAVFQLRVDSAIHLSFGFALLLSVIGYKKRAHFLNQSKVKPKQIVTCSHAFSRA